MTYTLVILRRAQQELQRLPRADYERVRDAIRALAGRVRDLDFHPEMCHADFSIWREQPWSSLP